jgi:replicative DNA helicase
MCISALSGGGKSTLGKCFRDSIWKNNPSTKFNQYIFNFEMLSSQQQARSIVSASGVSLKKLYSVEEPLTEAEMEYLKKYYNELAKRQNTWFIETPASAQHIAASLLHYYHTECKPEGRALMYEIDHALLTKGRTGASEKERIDELMYALVHVKKEIAADGGTSNGIVLSQMNRDIRSLDRVKNSDLHRCSSSDLFGASSIIN